MDHKSGDDRSANVDPGEVAKFDALASRWWDRDGDFRTLHDINPLRLGFIAERVALGGKMVIDVGCGGGLLSEAMADRGAGVTGIDTAGAIRLTWIVSAALAALAGVLYGVTVQVRPEMGLNLLLPLFTAAILGGVGSVPARCWSTTSA